MFGDTLLDSSPAHTQIFKTTDWLLALAVGAAGLLAGLLGHTVTCHYSINTALIGGIKIQVADWIVDSSLSSQLTNIAHSLLTV